MIGSDDCFVRIAVCRGGRLRCIGIINRGIVGGVGVVLNRGVGNRSRGVGGFGRNVVGDRFGSEFRDGFGNGIRIRN